MILRVLRIVATLCVAAGCAQKPNAPPPPNVDPLPAQTSNNPLVVTGSAEFGATVNVTGGAQPASGIADQFTARFRIPVTLSPGSNTLSFTATDTRNNLTSAAFQADPVVLTAPTAKTTTTIAASVTAVDPQTNVFVFAQVRDAYGNLIPCTSANQSQVIFSATGPAPVSPTGAVTCLSTQFEAVFSFTQLGVYSVTATYTGDTPNSSASLSITVQNSGRVAPTVNIPLASVFVNGTACVLSGAPPACIVNPGDFVQFNIVANDNVGLSEIRYSAFFASVSTQLSESILVPSNATLPYSQTFTFTIPGAAFFEDVPLTAMAINSSGIRSSTPALLLRLQITTFKGRVATVVARDYGAGFINAPEGVVLAANGDLYIANTGNSNILRVPDGGTFPTVYLPSLPGGGPPSFLARDSSGNLFVTSRGPNPSLVFEVPATAPSNPVTYVGYTNGASLHGFASDLAVPAKALVNVQTASPVADGDRLTIGTTVYEVNVTSSATPNCPNAGGTPNCVNVSSGAAATVAAALADCINLPGGTGGTGCTTTTPSGSATTAHPNVSASLSSTTDLVLAAKTAGAAGNAIALANAACPRILLNNNTTCGSQATALSEGHDATFFVGQEGGGPNTSVVYRFPFTLTGLPKNESSNDGNYDMFLSGANHEQWGLAVKDLTTSTSPNLRDLAFYFPDVTLGQDRLRGVRVVNNGSALPIFSTAANANRPGCADCIRGTNDPTTPGARFNSLWDVVAQPIATTNPAANNGCLVVSDRGNGNIYVVDARDPTVADPRVSLAATGLPDPRGMAFGPDGALYVALTGADAVLKITPSGPGCF